jgi:DNA replicative helicase MCM subunit Mcm2 (Cdc46/Mcm family)
LGNVFQRGSTEKIGERLRQRIQVKCPLCGRTFDLEVDVTTYLTAEPAMPQPRSHTALILRGHEAKVDFVLRAMRALASKDPSGIVEVDEIVEIAEKVGLSRDDVEEILSAEKGAGRIYEPKQGFVSFTAPPERSRA